MTQGCIHSVCYVYVGLVSVEDCYGLLVIEGYLVVVRVCCMKYACGVVLLAWLFYVFGGDTQLGIG